MYDKLLKPRQSFRRTLYICTHEGEREIDLIKFNKELLHDLHSPPNIIRVIKSSRLSGAGRVPHTEIERNACTFLLRKLENKRPLPNSRCGWKDYINTDLKYVGWEDVHWIGLAQIKNKLRVLIERVMNFLVP